MTRDTRPAPRIMGGDKSTWAPRPKMSFKRIASPEPVAMETRREKMVGGDKSTWGLTNSKAAIHDDIRRMARRIEREPPTMEVMKKEMKITTLPTIEEADKESEVQLKKII